MGTALGGNRLTPDQLQKINGFVNAAIENNIKGKDSAKINEAKLLKQVKVDVNKQIAPYLKQGVEASLKTTIDKTVDKTITDSWNAAKTKLKSK
ncbi:MAG: hypothetical protein LUQ65_06300 [Candidatus Helarchaeota archaeon]|nr:hypothetical protein [Candidatus Helarchaeota archaeon]